MLSSFPSTCLHAIHRDVPVRWCAWTRPGCRLGSRCRCTAAAGPSACSRSGCSGRRCPRPMPAARAGGATRRWPSPPPGAPCTAAPGAHSSGSTPAAEERETSRNHRVRETTNTWGREGGEEEQEKERKRKRGIRKGGHVRNTGTEEKRENKHLC